MNVEDVDLIVEGQGSRTVLANTHDEYLSKVRVITRLMVKHLDIFKDALVLDEDGAPTYHSGQANKVHKIALPLLVTDAQRLFGIISVDETLPSKRKRGNVDNVDVINEGNNNNNFDETDPRNPARNVVTVSAQTYQNYKSALKWWHELNNEPMDKVGCLWPIDVDKALVKAIAAYKRDVGQKKRKGVMKQKEGKSSYNLNGYIAICKFFMGMRPNTYQFSWSEGLFAALFHKMSVNTMGRSDNIDDILSTNIDWENDYMKICFAITKSDQCK